MKNPMVYFEIYANDPKALAGFYTELFDWKVEASPGMEGYLTVKTVDVDAKGKPDVAGINGGIMKSPGPGAPSVINYVGVDSVDGALEKAQRLGAKVMKAKSAVPQMGYFAILTDPQGNPFALWQMDKAAK